MKQQDQRWKRDFKELKKHLETIFYMVFDAQNTSLIGNPI